LTRKRQDSRRRQHLYIDGLWKQGLVAAVLGDDFGDLPRSGGQIIPVPASLTLYRPCGPFSRTFNRTISTIVATDLLQSWGPLRLTKSCRAADLSKHLKPPTGRSGPKKTTPTNIEPLPAVTAAHSDSPVTFKATQQTLRRKFTGLYHARQRTSAD
jgi:hypothetical protein